ncbi:MAG TPA: PQQ-binding-like beta-propeller repeat protein [Candidatus Paceibacterota bacterium]
MEPINQLEQQPPLSPQSNDFRKRIILIIGTVLAIVIVAGLIYWVMQKPPTPSTPPGDLSPPPATVIVSTWPQFGYDPQSSGQAPFKGPQTNKPKWVYKLGSTSCGLQTIAVTPVLDKDGNLYFGTSEGSFISLDPKMNKRWEYKLPDAYPRNINCKSTESGVLGGLYDLNIMTDPALTSSSLVVFGTSGINNAKKIYALDLSGQLKWMYAIDGSLESAIKIGPNNQIYFTTQTTIYSLSDTGQNAKTYPMTGRLNTPAIGKDGAVYVCSAEGLLALTTDLKLKWTFSQVRNLRTCSPAIDPKTGVIYFPYKKPEAKDYKLYAVNPDGSFKWSSNIFWTESSPAVASDGTIYVGTTDLSVDTTTHNYQARGSGELIALNADGSRKWSYNVKPIITCKKGSDPDCPNADRWQSGTAIDLLGTIGPDGTIYFGSDGTRYFALNSNGTEKWVFQGGDEWDHRAVIASDGTLYAVPGGGIYGGIYAFNDAGGSQIQPQDESLNESETSVAELLEQQEKSLNNSSEPGGR